MTRARYNEVPKDYRRKYKKEFVEFLKVFAICLVCDIVLLLLIFR